MKEIKEIVAIEIVLNDGEICYAELSQGEFATISVSPAFYHPYMANDIAALAARLPDVKEIRFKTGDEIYQEEEGYE